MKYTATQLRFFKLIEGTSDNYFLTGGPGTGKSVLINYLATQGKKQYTLAAPTGMAALNINGKTLNSIFGIPTSGIIPPDYNIFNANEAVTNHVRYQVNHLIIDEISMVRVDMLEYIHRALCHYKGNDRPFGGIQVIACGDFFQLPPVIGRGESIKPYPHPFCFGSKLFQTFTTLQLKTVLRQQGDPLFQRILDEARYGEVSQRSIDKMNANVKPLKDLCIQLVGANREGDEINTNELGKLRKKATEFHADAWGNWPAFPVDPVITLKVGAQVLVKKNGADIKSGPRSGSSIVNGTIGKVYKIEEDSIDIELKDKRRVTIHKMKWEKKIKERNSSGEWEERTLAGFTQLPIILAWAISMHKSQGQTFERVHINPRRIFAPGQLYVAISRCKTLKGITFSSRVVKERFFTDPHVIKFNNKIK